MIHSKEEEGSESVGLLLRVMLVRGELQVFTPLSGSSPSLFLPHQIEIRRILLRFNQWGHFHTGLWGKYVDIWKTQTGKGIPEGKEQAEVLQHDVLGTWQILQGCWETGWGLMTTCSERELSLLLYHAFRLSHILVHAVIIFLLYTMKIILAPLPIRTLKASYYNTLQLRVV